MFDKIKRFCDMGLYTAEQVQRFVPKYITAEQYEDITHEVCGG